MYFSVLFRWRGVEFPLPFGRTMSPAEEHIHSMDEKVFFLISFKFASFPSQCPSYISHKFPFSPPTSCLALLKFPSFQLLPQTGASLKLTILNPRGRIWTMVAGGGASVIYADTVGDLGYAQELGNYAEYSGAPNEGETLNYARTLIDVSTGQQS